MSRRALVRLVAGALALGVLGACDKGDGDVAGIPSECGLPTPDPRLRSEIVPSAFLPDSALLTSAQRERGGFLAAISIPRGVEEALKLYKDVVEAEGFEVISEDNEIFEAEIYMQRGKKVGALQIRRSLCEDASIVFVNIIATKRSDEPVPFPVPSGARTPTAVPEG